LGGTFGELENAKSKIETRLEIGLWKIDVFKKVGRRTIPPLKCHKIHHNVKRWDDNTNAIFKIITSKTTTPIL
jgi:hypothetical protein